MHTIAILLIILLCMFTGLGFFYRLSPQFGGRPNPERKERMIQSNHFRKGRFWNLSLTPLLGSLPNRLKAVIDYAIMRGERTPARDIPVVPLVVNRDETMLRVFWLGHSTVLILMDGKTILTDPVLSHRASPLRVAGPKSFYNPFSVSPERLSQIDVMVITHDHYDHLDYKAIRKLDGRTRSYVVPLGVGSHLEAWGVRPDKIHECDWWERVERDGISFTATPTRHFSGRGPFDRFKTLWAAFVIEGAGKRLFFGGDSGYDQGFEEIGARLGPFDLTFLECGAYSPYWPNIHMVPEDTVRAHADLKGKVLIPIHWARFNLSVHDWTEPVERLLAQASKDGVAVVTPMIGQAYDLDGALETPRWWKMTDQDNGRESGIRVDGYPAR